MWGGGAARIREIGEEKERKREMLPEFSGVQFKTKFIRRMNPICLNKICDKKRNRLKYFPPFPQRKKKTENTNPFPVYTKSSQAGHALYPDIHAASPSASSSSASTKRAAQRRRRPATPQTTLMTWMTVVAAAARATAVMASSTPSAMAAAACRCRAASRGTAWMRPPPTTS